MCLHQSCELRGVEREQKKSEITLLAGNTSAVDFLGDVLRAEIKYSKICCIKRIYKGLGFK